MARLTPHDITTILLAIGTLLASARILGEVATRFRQPAVIGEILAGILLGPTLLGQVAPEVFQSLFAVSTAPGSPSAPAVVLAGLSTIAVVLFLLVAGMEVDLSTVFKQGKVAFAVGISGIALPFLIGFGFGWIGESMLGMRLTGEVLGGGGADQRLLFSLFVATALSISALPVIARILMDLNLYRTDLGMTVIAAAIFDDLVGWLFFALILANLGLGTGHGLGVGPTVLFTLLFAGGMLTIGRRLLDRLLPWIQAKTSWPGGVLSFALVLALLGAALAEWIGVHAIFGSFIVGVALGDSAHLKEKTRATIDQFISYVFAPIFFATIGLRVNFVEHFDLLLVVVVLVIAAIGKVVGCGLGAMLAGMPKREAWAVGFGMNARGAMEIILGMLAYQHGLIGEKMLVALVVMAIVTSVAGGPIMQRILRRQSPRRFLEHLHARAFVNPLRSTTAEGAIAELSDAAAAATGMPAQRIRDAVIERERLMSTGIGHCIAVPHARFPEVQRPIVVVGISPFGVDFDAADGQPTRLVLMTLTPTNDDGAQVQILADLARTVQVKESREALWSSRTFTEFVAAAKASTTAIRG